VRPRGDRTDLAAPGGNSRRPKGQDRLEVAGTRLYALQREIVLISAAGQNDGFWLGIRPGGDIVGRLDSGRNATWPGRLGRTWLAR
jgi:hypothetical protein